MKGFEVLKTIINLYLPDCFVDIDSNARRLDQLFDSWRDGV